LKQDQTKFLHFETKIYFPKFFLSQAKGFENKWSVEKKWHHVLKMINKRDKLFTKLYMDILPTQTCGYIFLEFMTTNIGCCSYRGVHTKAQFHHRFCANFTYKSSFKDKF